MARINGVQAADAGLTIKLVYRLGPRMGKKLDACFKVQLHRGGDVVDDLVGGGRSDGLQAQDVAAEREAEQLRSDQRSAPFRLVDAKLCDRAGDEVLELSVELAGDGVIGDGGPEKHHERVVGEAVLPAFYEMPDHELTALSLGYRSEVRDLQVSGRGGSEEPGLGSEVAHHHRWVDARLGGDGADRCLLVAASGEPLAGDLEDCPPGGLRAGSTRAGDLSLDPAIRWLISLAGRHATQYKSPANNRWPTCVDLSAKVG
jgi:hypothetical protein